MRKYEASHPWISFQFNLGGASAPFWLLLGEAAATCEEVAHAPLRPKVHEEMLKIYLAKGVAATTAIEGNTLTEEEVRKQIDGSLQVPASKEYLKTEVANVLRCLKLIDNRIVRDGETKLTTHELCQYNRLLLNGLELADEVVPGKIRTHSVGVLGYRGAPAEDCEYLLDRLFDWLAGPDFRCDPILVNGPVIYAIIRAIIAHLYIAWIHPFGDGNGRAARIVEYQILVACGAPRPAAHLMSNHYNQTRQEYYRQLDRASKTQDPLPFVAYAVNGLVEGLRQQAARVREQQLDVVWKTIVFTMFSDDQSATSRRRRNLALELKKRGGVVAPAAIKLLSPEIAAAYARKTQKTLMRDVNELERSKVIEKTAAGYRANHALVRQFLPFRFKPIEPARGK